MMPQLCSVRDLIAAFAKAGFVLVTDLNEPFLIFEREPHDLVHLSKGELVDEDGGVFLDILAQDLESIGHQIADPDLSNRIFGHLAEAVIGPETKADT